MMKRRRFPLFAKELLAFVIISLILYEVTFFFEQINVVDQVLANRRKEIYAAAVGLHGTLLGFIIAAVTIALTIANSPRFEILRRSGQWPNLFGSYTRSMRWAAVATLLSFVALIIDNDASPNRLAAIFCISSIVFSTLAITHMLWVTEKTVKVVVAAKARMPGE